jgi:hypothetical protein
MAALKRILDVVGPIQKTDQQPSRLARHQTAAGNNFRKRLPGQFFRRQATGRNIIVDTRHSYYPWCSLVLSVGFVCTSSIAPGTVGIGLTAWRAAMAKGPSMTPMDDKKSPSRRKGLGLP